MESRVVALAGNPNVGKSTVFNALTGMNQHTGNWTGKTVASAKGYFKSNKCAYTLVDLPGTYSLMAHSAEEEAARDFICFASPDAVAVVCDATCLERNLCLLLQIMEVSKNVVLCLNLTDEAERKGIHIDTALLEKLLGIPVISTVARKKKSLLALVEALDKSRESGYLHIEYEGLDDEITRLEEKLSRFADRINPRWLAIKVIEGDEALCHRIFEHIGEKIAYKSALSKSEVQDVLTLAIAKRAEEICAHAVTYKNENYAAADRRIDRILTGKYTAFPVMIALLLLIFWITISGANYPSAWLSALFDRGEAALLRLFEWADAPKWLSGVIVDGLYRVLSWVVAVMLPPMAVFFPLFTLLEDLGYLPRIAYNLDRPFKRCNACGKQALTMCMGFGCNAVGVTGCRIIDSPRERLLAILTNSLVPCNGRFPTLIAMLALIFAGAKSAFLTAAGLTLVIVISVAATFFVTKLLSVTLLRGVPSSFTLELPPYRRPQVGKILLRSVFDRTLFVLGRAVAVAAPAGIMIWILTNTGVLGHFSRILDPFARLMGLDGVILMAFIMGFPASEIVVPIMVMAYLSQGTLTEISAEAMRTLFLQNGWTPVTAVCVIIFSLFHFPCSTTLMTVKKETGSLKWTALAAILPTMLGIILCMIVNLIMK